MKTYLPGIIFDMRILFLALIFLVPSLLFSQTTSDKWPRAFPITDYMVDINDSVKLVQIEIKDGVTIPEKQVGVLKGRYRDKPSDTAEIGIGRCNLIKGVYYYFTIGYKKSGIIPKQGDLLYTMIKRPAFHEGRLLRIAAHFIELQNVYGEAWFDRNTVFNGWSADKEKVVLDSMLKDAQFTADYFLKNNPSMNVKVVGGRYDGKMVLNAMLTSTPQDLADFLDYINARPNNYAGNQWKTAEIFATWLSSGAPTVIK